MKIYLNCTANLGDFLNALPVLSGISKSYGKPYFIIRNKLKKFKGIKEFLLYQDIFDDVVFDDEIFLYGDSSLIMSSWTREDKNNHNRPTETCRYENWMKDNYNLSFDVDDDIQIKYPDVNVVIDDNYYVGDRWNVFGIDDRRRTNVLSYLSEFNMLSYDTDILTNCYIIKNSKKPFITNFTGVSILSDLLNKETFVVWKSEDWNEEFRKGDDVKWDNGKNIQQVFAKHFYGNRYSKLIHAKDLKNIL
jgi:hypothetical protein